MAQDYSPPASASAPFADSLADWVTTTVYAIGEEVIESTRVYTCLIAHTAGVFATDLASGNWGELSKNIIVGDTVSGGSAAAFLHVDGSGNLANAPMTTDGTTVTLTGASNQLILTGTLGARFDANWVVDINSGNLRFTGGDNDLVLSGVSEIDAIATLLNINDIVIQDATPSIRWNTGAQIGTMNWTPTGTRTITFQDATGTVAFIADIPAAQNLTSVLTEGEATGANNITVDAGQSIATDTILETTAANGVDIDGIKLQDGGSLVITGGANTFNMTNGTAVLDLAAGANVNFDFDLIVNTVNVTLDQDLQVTSNPTFGNLTITSFAANWTNAGRTVADIGSITTGDWNGGTIDGTVIGGSAAAAITGTAIIGTSLNDGALTFTSGTVTGTWVDLGSVTTTDINGGTIDGTIIGGAVAAAITGAAIIGTSINDGAITSTSGTVTGTWVDLGSVTTIDINGGTIDGNTIGGSVSAAGTFTDLAADGAALTDTTASTGAATFSVVNSSAANAMHVFDDGSTSLGFATAQPYRLFVRDTSFGTGIFVAQLTASGTPEGIIVSVTGAATTNTGIRVSATNATNNFAIDVNGGDVRDNLSAGSWGIGPSSLTATSKLTVLVSSASSHDISVDVRNGNTLALNTGVSSVMTGAGTTSRAGYFSSTGATNNYALITDAGIVGIGTTTPTSLLHIDQSSLTGAVPVLTLDQADLSEQFIDLVSAVAIGNPLEAVGAKTLTVTHFARVDVNGAPRFIQLGTIA